MTEKLKGGVADNKTLQDIADKHGVSLSVIESALADGIKVESEHTSEVGQAEEIAKDHLFEDAEYYVKLAQIEKQNEAGHWITVKPHEDGKGTHVFIKEGQTAKEAIDEKFEDKKESKKEDIGTYIDERGKTKSLKNLKSIIDYMDWQDDSINFAKGIEGEGKIKGENYVIFAPYKVTKLGGLSADQRDGIKQNYLRKITNVLKGKSSNIQERGDGTFAIIYDESKIKEALSKKEKQNSKDWAKVYRAANFIEKGVCTYKEETIYLSQETLQKAMPTMKGRPVVIKHQKVTPENMQEHAVGYVSEANFDSIDASFGCNFLVFDDEGKEVIANDYSVSCAYIPKAFGQGGTWHNTPYDREVTDLEFTHLALVPDPRYEDAKIYENSKDDDTTWITLKGNHIPIKKGQNKEEAVKSFFKDKNNKNKSKKIDKNYYNIPDEIKKEFYKGDEKPSPLSQKAYEIGYEIGNKYNIGINSNDLYYDRDISKKWDWIHQYEEEDTFYQFFRAGIFDGSEKLENGEHLYKKNEHMPIPVNCIRIGEIPKSKFSWNFADNKQEKGLSVLGFIEENGEFKEQNDGTYEMFSKDKNKSKIFVKGFLNKMSKGGDGEPLLLNPKKIGNVNTEKQNKKEIYNMEKIEVEQGFLSRLLEMAQKPFLNAKEEEKSKEDKDEDEMEYEGEKYSKKELVNCYKAKKNEMEKEKSEADKKEDKKEEEKKNSVTSDEMQYFNAIQAKIEAGQSQQQEIISTWTDSQGEKEGYDMFRMK